MMRWLLLMLPFTSAVLGDAQLGMLQSGTGDSSGTGGHFVVMKIGAGGQLTKLDIECDQGVGQCNGNGTVTMTVATDTHGGWIWTSAVGRWYQVVTSASLPTAGKSFGNGQPVYEIRIAPSNTSHLYMHYEDGCIYSSTTKGATWTQTGFSCLKSETYGGAPQKFMSPYMGVDPVNDNVVYTGTPSNGVYYTTNGGASWTNLPTSIIPAGMRTYGNLIFFDPSDGTGNTVYITSYGSGVWKCTNAASSPSCGELNSTGMPTTFGQLRVDQKGTLWVLDNGGHASGSQPAGALNEYTSGAWTEIAAAGTDWQTLAIDTNNCLSSSICVLTLGAQNGALNSRLNGIWTRINGKFSRAATDIPWLAQTNERWMTAGQIVYDPSQTNGLIFVEGIGAWRTTPPTSSSANYTYTSLSAPIEQLVSNRIISPPGGAPLYLVWDRGVFRVNNAAQYPSAQSGCNPPGYAITTGWDADWASTNPNIIVALCNETVGGAHDASGISTNGGRSFTPFGGSAPFNKGKKGGCITTTDGTHIVWIASNAGGPYLSTDGGNTWNAITISGISGDVWSHAYYLDRKNCIADRVDTSTFYMSADDGRGHDWFVRSTDNGATWSIRCTQCGGSKRTLFPLGYGAGPVKFQSIVGHVGYLLAVDGQWSFQGHAPLVMSTDGGATWSAVNGISNVWSFGQGAACNGADFSIVAYGTIGKVSAIWRGDYSIGSGAFAWTQLSGVGPDRMNSAEYPANSLDSINDVQGDNNACNTVYIGFAGSGAAYRTN